MLKKQVNKKTILLLFLLTSFVAGCSALNLKSQSPKEEERSTDICTSGIEVFILEEEEFEAMSDHTIKNALLVNCTLYTACGYRIPNPDVCVEDTF